MPVLHPVNHLRVSAIIWLRITRAVSHLSHFSRLAPKASIRYAVIALMGTTDTMQECGYFATTSPPSPFIPVSILPTPALPHFRPYLSRALASLNGPEFRLMA